LPASADPRAAVEREVVELERLCGVLERHLVAGNWNEASRALQDARRVTHGFLNAMEAAQPVRDEAFDRAIHARMRRVFDVREDQLSRLRAFRDATGERLAAFARWKSFARSIGAKKARSQHSVGLDSTR
jgi:phage gp29-like protein